MTRAATEPPCFSPDASERELLELESVFAETELFCYVLHGCNVYSF